MDTFPSPMVFEPTDIGGLSTYQTNDVSMKYHGLGSIMTKSGDCEALIFFQFPDLNKSALQKVEFI